MRPPASSPARTARTDASAARVRPSVRPRSRAPAPSRKPALRPKRCISSDAGIVVAADATSIMAMGSVARVGSGASCRPTTPEAVPTSTARVWKIDWAPASSSTLRFSAGFTVAGEGVTRALCEHCGVVCDRFRAQQGEVMSHIRLRVFAAVTGLCLAASGSAQQVLPPPLASGPASDVPVAVQILRWHMLDNDVSSLAFRSMDTLFTTRTVPRGGAVWPLPHDDRPLDVSYSFGGQRYTAQQFLDRTYTNALLVMKDGRIVSEIYRNATHERSRFMGWSMTKSVTAVLVGCALADGRIDSLDTPISRYLPELNGGGYEGVSIRHVMQMRSGVEYEERYDFANPGRAATNHIGSLVKNVTRFADAARTLPRIHEPGSRVPVQDDRHGGAGLAHRTRDTWQRGRLHRELPVGAARRRGRRVLHHGWPAWRRSRVQRRGLQRHTARFRPFRSDGARRRRREWPPHRIGRLDTPVDAAHRSGRQPSWRLWSAVVDTCGHRRIRGDRAAGAIRLCGSSHAHRGGEAQLLPAGRQLGARCRDAGVPRRRVGLEARLPAELRRR